MYNNRYDLKIILNLYVWEYVILNVPFYLYNLK